jgi:hypothetical protein
MDPTKLQIVEFIQERPGTLKRVISEYFGLTEYRLNRVLRNLESEFKDIAFPWSHEHGVWLVKLDQSRCLGMDWMGIHNHGYTQCPGAPEFSDGRCYEHSGCESLEMVAFGRKLAYCLGPGDPNPQTIMSLGIIRFEELYETLKKITPLTKLEFEAKMKLARMFATAYATLIWKQRMRERSADFRIPPEFEARHRASSINPFEYSLKKLFALLEITPDSTREETLKAWKRLAREHHPDVHEGEGDEEKMKQVNMAKEKIFRIRRWD